MSVLALKAQARKHWSEFLPNKVAELKNEGRLNEELHAAACLAQAEIEHLMKQGYPEYAAREVALPLFILLKPELPDEPDEQDEELAEREREYQKNPPPESLMYAEEHVQENLIRQPIPASSPRSKSMDTEKFPTTPPPASRPGSSSPSSADPFEHSIQDWDAVREDHLLKALREVNAEREVAPEGTSKPSTDPFATPIQDWGKAPEDNLTKALDRVIAKREKARKPDKPTT